MPCNPKIWNEAVQAPTDQMKDILIAVAFYRTNTPVLGNVNWQKVADMCGFASVDSARVCIQPGHFRKLDNPPTSSRSPNKGKTESKDNKNGVKTTQSTKKRRIEADTPDIVKPDPDENKEPTPTPEPRKNPRRQARASVIKAESEDEDALEESE